MKHTKEEILKALQVIKDTCVEVGEYMGEKELETKSKILKDYIFALKKKEE